MAVLLNGRFQSPQWGSNSKGLGLGWERLKSCFSPRNGEVILKEKLLKEELSLTGFSPRNGEVILKQYRLCAHQTILGFSPRNGEVILKTEMILKGLVRSVSVPAMGK